jgi:hypothetical protein
MGIYRQKPVTKRCGVREELFRCARQMSATRVSRQLEGNAYAAGPVWLATAILKSVSSTRRRFMQLHGQMARVPVTARQKFSEAAYFYNEMIGYRTNSIVFPYYLSAFVSALRSVTYYLQKQYAHDARFTEWYGKKQEAMKADPALKILHEKRNTALHVEPFDLYFKQGFKRKRQRKPSVPGMNLVVK